MRRGGKSGSGLDNFLEIDRSLKRAIQISVDCLLMLLCFVLAMLLRHESLDFVSDPSIWLAPAVTVPLSVIVFGRLGLYRAVVRFITERALRTIIAGILFSTMTLALTGLGLGLEIPQSVPVIYALLLFLTVGGVRFALRALMQKRTTRNKSPVLIYGAGEAGRQLANALEHGSDYAPLAFVDDDPRLHGAEVAGLKIHAPRLISQLIDRHDIKTILLALPSAKRSRRRAILSRLDGLPVEVRTMPGISDIVSGRARVNDLSNISADDLLCRDPVPPDPDLMSTNITGKSVMVTGAGGSIGSELCRQILRLNPSALIMLDVSEAALYKIDDELQRMARHQRLPVRLVPLLGSVQTPRRMETILRTGQVQTIYHAAAYKHVPLVEHNVVEGIRNNVFGTETLARAAIDAGVESFILVSTDKAVRPTNIMGASKRMAELVCQSLARSDTGTVFSMVRFGNVLGSSGSVIPRFREQIERGGPVTVTHPEITRYFMTIPEAAQLVIQAGAMARGGDVFFLDMGEPVRIVDLAERMIRLHGLEPYFVDPGHSGPQQGDIGITFGKLRPGEKLFEELMIGNAPTGTEHPRILCARELSLAPDVLSDVLDALLEACHDCHIDTIRKILMQAPTGYRPGAGADDLLWVEGDSDVQALQPRRDALHRLRKASERVPPAASHSRSGAQPDQPH